MLVALLATATVAATITATPVAAAVPSYRASMSAVSVAAAVKPTCAVLKTPAQAVTAASSYAAGGGVTALISVRDRSTGKVLGSTANASTQVGSESIMKLLLATYYLLLYGGYQKTPADVKDRLSYMLRYSDDYTASSLFSANAIPTVAARYKLGRTTNATDRPGHWGAARITAADMTYFLFRTQRDSAVGPWLIPVMAQTTAVGSDGFNQKFGLNALTGTHGSKQGWGKDSFYTSPKVEAIHSVGYTKSMFVAVLQIANGRYPDPMRATATYAARTIQAADPLEPSGQSASTASSAVAGGGFGAAIPTPARGSVPGSAGSAGSAGSGSVAGSAGSVAGIPDGRFVQVTGRSEIYRIAGQAPVYVSTWAAFGGPQPVQTISQAQLDALRQAPADGTFVSSAQTGKVYTIAGGSPIFVSSWAAVGGKRAVVTLDAVALERAGRGGVYNHLNARPAGGTFVRAYSQGRVYRIVGAAPVVVTSWAAVGGQFPAATVDSGAVERAGSGNWNNLRMLPINGTFVRARSTGHVYVIAGGAPIFVPSWPSMGVGPQTTYDIDSAAVTSAGRPGPFRHLLFYPHDGTFIRGYPSGRTCRVLNGVPHYISSWTPYGGPQPTVRVPQVSVDRAGMSAPYSHLKRG